MRPRRSGFEIAAVLVFMVNGFPYEQDFPIRVFGRDKSKIKSEINRWKKYLTKVNDGRVLVVKGVYRVERMSKREYQKLI